MQMSQRFPVDEDGLPGSIGLQGEFDGGDTAAILGTMIALVPQHTLGQWCNKIGFVGYGPPRRHPDFSKWYGQYDRFSRDQLIPVICAGIRLKFWAPIEEVYGRHKQLHFVKAWNTKKNGAIEVPTKSPDITGPEVWALWIRYKRPWWARLVLVILDLESLASAIHWKYWRKDRVCRNHMLSSIMSRRYMPTLVSRLTYWLNDWPILIAKWAVHCEVTKEYDTSNLFLYVIGIYPETDDRFKHSEYGTMSTNMTVKK